MIADNNQKIEQSIELLLSVETNRLKEETQEEVIYEINAAVTTLENIQEVFQVVAEFGNELGQMFYELVDSMGVFDALFDIFNVVFAKGGCFTRK